MLINAQWGSHGEIVAVMKVLLHIIPLYQACDMFMIIGLLEIVLIFVLNTATHLSHYKKNAFDIFFLQAKRLIKFVQ